MTNSLLERLRIDVPIIQAPMGGGPGTPELAAAVSNAGGLGSLALAYLSIEQLRDEIARTRKLTSRPINLNLFAGGWTTELDRDPAPMLAIMRSVHDELQLPSPELPPLTADPFPAQVDAVIDAKPEVFSFTFGVPDEATMRRLHASDIFVIGTATTAEEGEILARSGVDAMVAQGAEAGAHRGTFAGAVEESLVPTLALVRAIRERTNVPVIASGGIMDGAEIAAALSAGAAAVQLGTAFLLCPEAGTSPAYREALRQGSGDQTVITRAFSGRAARGLRNRFIEMVPEDAILPFPVQNTLTRQMRATASKAGQSAFLSLWAGTGVTRIREMPAAELVDVLMREVSP